MFFLKQREKKKRAISLQVSPILLKICDLAETRNQVGQRNGNYLRSPLLLVPASCRASSPQTFFWLHSVFVFGERDNM